MAGSVYPGALDDFSESSPSYMSDPDATGRTHEGRHNDVESAVEQVQETLGVNPQGSNATVAERISPLTTVNNYLGVSTPNPNAPLDVTARDGTAIAAQFRFRPANNDLAIIGFTDSEGTGVANWSVDRRSGTVTMFIDAAAHVFRNILGNVRAGVDSQGLTSLDRRVATHYWDESVGRRLFIWDTVNARWQMVYGDTGSRDISSLVTSDWASVGALRLRRVGNVVSVHGHGLVRSTPGSGVLVNLSQGFAEEGGGFYGHAEKGSELAVWEREVYVNTLAGTSDAIGLTFFTADPWPTVLPGVPIGAIPTVGLLAGDDTPTDIDRDIPTGITPDDDTSGWTVTYPDGPTP